MPEHETPPAGWYADTEGTQLRWWDGSAWSGHIAPMPTSATRPGMELVAERKRVYSHDMLYVADAAGEKVGRINLNSGKVTIDRPELRSEFDEFVARWSAEGLPTSKAVETPLDDPGTPIVAAEGQSPTTADPAVVGEVVGEKSTWQDLSQNLAGQAVRERAMALRAGAPVKTLVARVFGVHTDERAYRVGADGEEEVAWRMRKLGDGWHVLHSVPVGEKDSDIDHVVVGPPGVFTLNTKNHSRKNVWVAETAFMVSGQKTNYLRNSRHEAARASKLLTAACGFDVQVEPILVVIAAELTIKAQPAGVHVVAHRHIGKWLERRPATLSPDAVEAVYEMARRDSTWRTA